MYLFENTRSKCQQNCSASGVGGGRKPGYSSAPRLVIQWEILVCGLVNIQMSTGISLDSFSDSYRIWAHGLHMSTVTTTTTTKLSAEADRPHVSYIPLPGSRCRATSASICPDLRTVFARGVNETFLRADLVLYFSACSFLKIAFICI